MYNRIAELLIGQPRSFHTLRHRNDLTCLSPFPLLFLRQYNFKNHHCNGQKVPATMVVFRIFSFYPPR